MNKFLPIIISFFFVLNSQSQNDDVNKKIQGFKNGQRITRNYSNVEIINKTSTDSPKVKTLDVGNLKTTAVTSMRFTGSMNVFGVLVSESKPLQYNKGVNAISFIHTKSVNYIPSVNGNSGSIIGMYSTNKGTSWDSTCIWANAVNLARFPQGGIYNPSGNTNINNAYMVGCGPITNGSGWIGDWYASKQITTPGTTTPGINQIAELDATPTMKKHSFSRYSFTAIDGGLSRSIANLVNDPNGISNATFGLRGAALVKGVFSAGAFTWNVDSFVPCVMSRSDGSKYLNEKMIQAWDDAGVVGYVVMLGVRCGVGPCLKSYQPIVYKTTTGGASWSLLPAYDFGSANPNLIIRLAPITTNSTATIPYFYSNEGMDAVVDINGQLHLACTVVGAYSSHNDSLDYIHSFGTEKYSYKETGPFEYPIIYDFHTKSTGGWSYIMVDSMGTEGPSGLFGAPGYATNVWSDGMGAKIDQSARIQMSRTDDGKKILYSWTESDSTTVGSKWNIYPDIKMKGFDVTLYKVTPRFNITAGNAFLDQGAYYHYMSNKAISTPTTLIEIPFSVTTNSLLNGIQPVNHYYIKGATFSSSSFSISPFFGGGITSTCASLGLDVPEKSQNINSFNIIPNPTAGLISVSFLIDKTQEVKLNISDYLGRIIESKNVKGSEGENSIPIDLSTYNSGLYLISIVTNSFTDTKKIIKE